MLPEVYISVFAGYRYDIGTHAAKRRKPVESDTFRANQQRIKSSAKDLTVHQLFVDQIKQPTSELA